MWTVLRCVLFVCGGISLAGSLCADDTIVEAPIEPGDRDHWAYRPLLTSPLPSVREWDWLRTPVDAYILAGLEKLELTGGKPAERTALLRRVTFDVTGLPPTLEELAAFQTDLAPEAYERLVERLLASPAYGERAAQHWLDLARYADTDGFEHDKVRSDAWRYRDWVIDACNRDLPYDEFLRQQLAGDELAGGDAVATMFCLAGPDMPDVNDQFERRHFRLNELTSAVGSVFLGLQIGCAECHDHKYDPISQADFYRLRAVFEPAVPELKRDAPYYILANQTATPPARLWIRGDHRRPGPTIEAELPRIAAVASPSQPPHAPGARTGLRLALAESLLNDARPLTARVIANRVWQQHFGRGLCATSSDFGLINAEPTHPELLDWLASDLIEHGWSLKHLHRRILLSATYQQASRSTANDDDWRGRLQNDPDHRWCSRSPRRRLDGESIRDALLEVADVLNRAQGGPGVQAPLPEELVSTLLKGQWATSSNIGDHTRRSIYLFARRNLRFPLLEAFDRPDANVSCAVRGRSTTAPQALVLLNGDLAVDAAQRLAERVQTASPDDAARVRTAYRLTLSRDPTDEERGRFEAFVADDEHGTQWANACLALVNSNEFLYCD